MRSICIVAILLGLGQTTRADTKLPRAEDKAEADRLFEEGRALLEQGDRANACQKFDQSFHKDPRAVGTMLNLGLCKEEVGQVASAIQFYAEARDRARDQKLPEHQQAAERKIAMLSPRLPHLSIELPMPLIASTRVLVDDTVIALDQLGDVPLDPGPHTITVTAPGKLPYESKLDIKEGEHRAVSVPMLEGAKTIVVHAPTDKRKLFGKLGVGVGAGLVVSAIGLGAYARHAYWREFPSGARDGEIVRDSSHNCWTALDQGALRRQCNEVGSTALDNARLVAHLATGTAIVGGAALITGAILWATAPRHAEQPTLAIDVLPGGAQVAITARF